MLIEFRVKNFRSLRDEQTLSLVASKDQSFRETHTRSTDSGAVPAILLSSAVYGANASGKSNLVKALSFMRGVVLESAKMTDIARTYYVQPFRLDPALAHEPCEFELTCWVDGVRYQYGFALTASRIVHEYLLVYKAFKPQRWFDRRFDSETNEEVFEFGGGFKGARHVWEKATRPDALFLSVAVQLNSEMLRPLYDWFAHRLVIFGEGLEPNHAYTLQLLKQPAQRKALCAFMAAADTSIADLAVVQKKNPGLTFQVGGGPPTIVREDMEFEEIQVLHRTEHGEVAFSLADESLGTRKLLNLAGPIFDMLRKGVILVVDELDASMHSLLVQQLIRLFHQPSVNSGGAQLIFTTHNTSLLDAHGLFRRDQIWLVEKDRRQASSLVSLAEFSPRKNEALERGYLQGRYGAIPLLQPWELNA